MADGIKFGCGHSFEYRMAVCPVCEPGNEAAELRRQAEAYRTDIRGMDEEIRALKEQLTVARTEREEALDAMQSAADTQAKHLADIGDLRTAVMNAQTEARAADANIRNEIDRITAEMQAELDRVAAIGEQWRHEVVEFGLNWHGGKTSDAVTNILEAGIRAANMGPVR